MELDPELWDKTLTFLSLTVRSLGLVLLFGVPIGVALTRVPKVAAPVTAVLAMLQTVPSLALVGLLYALLPFMRLGAPAAITAAVVYSVFPVVLNTHVGITGVSPAVRDAARGMGMTPLQILLRVELPLALPVILAGVRTAAVYVISIITIAALLGAGGLGDYVVQGLQRGDPDLSLLGVVPILILTFLFFWGLGGIARLAKRDSGLGLVLAGGLVVLLSGYALAEPYLRPRRADVIIGAKNFTAGRILSEILRIMLQEHTDLSVELKANLGSKLAYQTTLRGDIDAYPEYTGNLLTGEDALALPVPADRSTITPLVRQEMSKQFGLAFLEPFGLNDTYVPCTTKERANTYGLKKLSDLRKVPEFRVAVDLEFTKRPDGWQGMLKTYDLHFRRPPMTLDPGLLYQALEKGQVDVVIGFASDWQIDALGLVELKDDRGYFPSYIGAPLVREALLKRHPEVATVLNRLAGQIDDAAIRRMSYEVVQRKRSEADVVREFLEEKGMIKRAR